MRPDRWRRVCAVLEEALELEEAERAGRLDERCADDPGLRREVESLLRAEGLAGDFLEHSPVRSGGEPALPARLGPYRLLEPLGRGGTSSVYLAVRDGDELGRRVAVKILRPGVGSDAGC